ncbi:MAG: sulfatase family protein, partial [Candidatus Binatia bacterium]
TYQVHFPYTPPAPYDEMFEPVDALQGPDERDRLRYEQETRYLDDEVGALLDAIDDLGLGVSTLVVVTADHGEEFMEHGARTHGFQLYEETAHVPLMLRLPGVITPGSRIADPVSLVDLAPTILDLTGAAPLVGIDGQSLAPLLGLGPLAPPPLTQGGPLLPDRRAVFAETHSGLLSGGSDVFSVRTAKVHCIFRPKLGTSQCYDPADDPDERVPLRGVDQHLLVARNQMVSYLALDPIAALPASRQAPAPVAPSAEDERQEKLRALGYLQ